MDGIDDDDDEIILDRRVMNSTSFNMRMSNETKKLSKEKWIILAVTCLSLGMFSGLEGPTLSYLSVIWFITIKSIGFLIGVYLSSYLFIWFNVYCLLSVSCFSISIGVCILPFLTNSIIFYFILLILGIGLGLVYNGIDVLYTRVCNQSSICWLHLLIPFGAILSTLLLLLSTMPTSHASCVQLYCCYNQNSPNETFVCYDDQSSGSDTCHSNNTKCQIHQICTDETEFDCLKESNVSKTTSQTRTIDHKMNLIYYSMRSIDYLYLLLGLLFFILSIFYSKLAIQRERVISSSITNLNPLALIIGRPYRIISNPNIQISFFTDRLSFALLVLILLFYFILSGIENSCYYLAYSFGIALKLSETKSLFLQLCYLFGRFIDLSINYIWFSFRKQTNQIPLKFFIPLRLIILFLLLFLFHLFQHFNHILFFSIGFLLASLSTLTLFWLERHFCLNDILLRMILCTIIISKSIFSTLLFHHLEHFLSIFFLIVLFLSILFLTQKWQEDRSYRLLTTLMETESAEISDNEDSNFH